MKTRKRKRPEKQRPLLFSIDSYKGCDKTHLSLPHPSHKVSASYKKGVIPKSLRKNLSKVSSAGAILPKPNRL